MAGFIGEEPVMWLFSFCLVVEIEKEVTTDGDAAVVSGFLFHRGFRDRRRHDGWTAYRAGGRGL